MSGNEETLAKFSAPNDCGAALVTWVLMDALRERQLVATGLR